MKQNIYKMKIVGYIKKDDHIEYTINIEKDNMIITFSERYSKLKILNDLMKNETKSNKFPKFPPKFYFYFKKEDEKFLNKRQKDLKSYFEIINKEFSHLKSFNLFIEENIRKYRPINPKKDSQQLNEIKKDDHQLNEKEIKLSSINNDKNFEYTKIINDSINKFIDLNSFYDKEMSNDNNHYTNYFNKNKIINDIINTPLESGRDNNFNYIGENLSERIYLQIKEKRKKVSEFYNSFDEKYDTKGIIVNV